MSTDLGEYAFEQFPRQPLIFKTKRRQLVSTLREYLHVSALENKGVPAYNLSNLGVLPDDQLGQIVPEILPSSNISLKDEFVWGNRQQNPQPIRLIPAKEPALTTFNLFNGIHSLNDISQKLAQEMGWETEYSFAYARGLFLWLVLLQVCQPKNT